MTEPKEIGIRELKEHTSEVLRQVRETRASYNVTYRGKVIARLVPVEASDKPTQEEIDAWLAEGEALTEEISKAAKKAWPNGVPSVAQLMAEERR